MPDQLRHSFVFPLDPDILPTKPPECPGCPALTATKTSGPPKLSASTRTKGSTLPLPPSKCGAPSPETEQQIQEELDNAFNQVDADRKAPPIESQHAAVLEQRSKSWLIMVTRMRVMVALSSMTSAVPGHRESPSLTEKWATASQ